MKIFLLSVSLVLIYLAIPTEANFWHDLGDSIDRSVKQTCRCPQALAGKVRCGYEINEAIGHPHHKHCKSNYIYSCDSWTAKEGNRRYRTHVVSKALDTCDREETCMTDGEERYCQYTRNRGFDESKRRKVSGGGDRWSSSESVEREKNENEYGAPKSRSSNNTGIPTPTTTKPAQTTVTPSP